MLLHCTPISYNIYTKFKPPDVIGPSCANKTAPHCQDMNRQPLRVFCGTWHLNIDSVSVGHLSIPSVHFSIESH